MSIAVCCQAETPRPQDNPDVQTTLFPYFAAGLCICICISGSAQYSFGCDFIAPRRAGRVSRGPKGYRPPECRCDAAVPARPRPLSGHCDFPARGRALPATGRGDGDGGAEPPTYACTGHGLGCTGESRSPGHGAGAAWGRPWANQSRRGGRRGPICCDPESDPGMTPNPNPNPDPALTLTPRD